MKVQCFHVFSPFSAHPPPINALHHYGKWVNGLFSILVTTGADQL